MKIQVNLMSCLMFLCRIPQRSFVLFLELEESSLLRPSNPNAPIPVSISAADFRNFMFAPYNGQYGNISDIHSASNMLINNVVHAISQSNSDLVYTYLQGVSLWYFLLSDNLFSLCAQIFSPTPFVLDPNILPPHTT